MKTKLRILPLLLGLAALLFTACPSDSCKIGAPTKQPSNNTHPYFGQDAVINVEEYNQVAMRPGDTITLLFPCKVTAPQQMPNGIGVTVSGNRARLWFNALRNTSASRLQPGEEPEALAPVEITVSFPTPHVVFTIYNHINDELWPGDTNGDGHRDMEDLYPIAMAIKDGITHCCPSITSSQLSYPPDVAGDMRTVYNVTPWGETFSWNSQQIDYVHADINMDEEINLLDVEYLIAVIQPMYRPTFLTSSLGNFSLQASYSQNSGVPVVQLDSCGHFTVTLPFEITLTHPNLTQISADEIFGILFSRPVAESPYYKLLRTEMVFDSSQIFSATASSTLWKQKFWPDFFIAYNSGNCINAIDKVLDVAAFKVGSTEVSVPTQSLRVGLCQVTLDDILKPGIDNPTPSLNLFQHLVNSVVFTHGDKGQIIANPVECTSDQTLISLEDLCDTQDCIIRETLEGDGSSEHTDLTKAGGSPDIWIRPAADTSSSTEHLQPISGIAQNVFVRVFNRSCASMDNVTAKVYWTYGSTNVTWGNFSSNLIGTSAPFSIPAFGNTIVTLPWTPSFSIPAPGCTPMISLLAVVETPADPILSFPDPTENINSWVLGINNAAIRSTIVINNGVTGNTHPIRTSILVPQYNASFFGLIIEQVEGSLLVPASNYGKLQVNLIGSSGFGTVASIRMEENSGLWQLDANETNGGLTFDSIPQNASFEVSYTLNTPLGSTQPIFNSPQKYAFRIYLTTYSTVLNSSIVQFTVQ